MVNNMGYYNYKANAANQIAKLNEAITYIETAKKKYEESLDELSDVKGFEKAEDLKEKLSAKINELDTLISSINSKISNINSKATSLQNAQDERITRERERREREERAKKERQANKSKL